jgi:pimeloyl-[acyl-carrier protein] methyl ester esterase
MWDALRALLPEWRHAVVDAGYFSKPVAPDFSGPVLAVAHSFGSLRVLSDPPDACMGVVFINGFTRFRASDDFPDGVPARALDRMLAKLSAESAAASTPTGIDGLIASSSKVVDDFRARCGTSAAPASLNAAVLARDLKTLRDDDLRGILNSCQLPWRALAGDADPIVSAAMTRATFDTEKIAWRDRGDHLLPLSDPAWCAMHIRNFLHTPGHDPAHVA